ncbi:MAG: hypothetical protein WBH97_01715 [Rectinemataceae bacterium]
MAEKKIINIENFEDLAIIAYHRAVVMKQKVTVLCPDPEAFVPAMLQLMTAPEDVSRLKVKEFVTLVDTATLLKESDLELKKANVLAYKVRD